jgi:hypothetical protein
MKSIPILEFKSNTISDILQSARGSVVSWSSPRLTTMYPIDGRPAGSNRGACRTVNGLLQVNVKPESFAELNSPTSCAYVTAGLWGEYSGRFGLIASTSYALDLVPPVVVPNDRYSYPLLCAYKSNGQLGFKNWQSFSNLAQNIYIKVSFVRGLVEAGIPTPPPIKLEFSCVGALLASDLS